MNFNIKQITTNRKQHLALLLLADEQESINLFEYFKKQKRLSLHVSCKNRSMILPLTSLRFIFALMVFGAHCYVITPLFDSHIFKEGFVGVSFFFVLSGRELLNN